MAATIGTMISLYPIQRSGGRILSTHAPTDDARTSLLRESAASSSRGQCRFVPDADKTLTQTVTLDRTDIAIIVASGRLAASPHLKRLKAICNCWRDVKPATNRHLPRTLRVYVRRTFTRLVEALLNSTASAQEAQTLAKFLAGDRNGIVPAQGTTTQQIVNDFRSGGRCAYLYLGKGTTLTSLNSDSIVACELTPTGRNRAVVLSGDLRAVVMPFPQAMHKIQDSISKLSAGPATQTGN